MDTTAQSRLELWAASSNSGARAATLAREAEAAGFDGITFGDTQCQNADAFVGLAVAAAATEQLRLGVGVTNAVTWHPATVACAIATVQHHSGGRAICGIGRGDSAVTKIGLSAATVSEFDRYVARLHAYLSGELVDTDGPLAQLTWIRDVGVPKVPVDVAATGPGVIGVGARRAELLTFNVGASPERVRRCIDLAREARRSAGLSAGRDLVRRVLGGCPAPRP